MDEQGYKNDGTSLPIQYRSLVALRPAEADVQESGGASGKAHTSLAHVRSEAIARSSVDVVTSEDEDEDEDDVEDNIEAEDDDKFEALEPPSCSRFALLVFMVIAMMCGITISLAMLGGPPESLPSKAALQKKSVVGPLNATRHGEFRSPNALKPPRHNPAKPTMPASDEIGATNAVYSQLPGGEGRRR